MTIDKQTAELVSQVEATKQEFPSLRIGQIIFNSLFEKLSKNNLLESYISDASAVGTALDKIPDKDLLELIREFRISTRDNLGKRK